MLAFLEFGTTTTTTTIRRRLVSLSVDSGASLILCCVLFLLSVDSGVIVLKVGSSLYGVYTFRTIFSIFLVTIWAFQRVNFAV
jgi:hypothetical protein